MLINELIQIFQSFNGQSLYAGLNPLTNLNVSIIFLNIIITVIYLIIIFLTVMCLIVILNIMISHINIDKDGKIINKKDINIKKYKEKLPIETSVFFFIFFLIGCFLLSSIIRVPEHYEVISFDKNYLVLRKDTIYIHNIFMNEKIYYKDIDNIKVYGKIFNRKKIYKYQCIFEFTMSDNKIVSFSILNQDMNKFKMKSCFPPETIFIKSFPDF